MRVSGGYSKGVLRASEGYLKGILRGIRADAPITRAVVIHNGMSLSELMHAWGIWVDRPHRQWGYLRKLTWLCSQRQVSCQLSTYHQHQGYGVILNSNLLLPCYIQMGIGGVIMSKITGGAVWNGCHCLEEEEVYKHPSP